MRLKAFLDSRLLRLVGGPIIRRLGTAIAVYLASKGIPEDQIDQLMTAVGVVLGLAFDIGLASVEKRKAENAGMRKALDQLSIDPAASLWEART